MRDRSDEREGQMESREALDLLSLLVTSGGWTAVTTGSGGYMLYTRWWGDDSLDTLLLRDEGNVLAERHNTYGQPVFRQTGTMVDVAPIIDKLPQPGTPNAPITVLPPQPGGIF